MRTTRDGLPSSSRSKSSSSTPDAVRENRLKLTPPSTTVAPSGELRPAAPVPGVPAATLPHSRMALGFICRTTVTSRGLAASPGFQVPPRQSLAQWTCAGQGSRLDLRDLRHEAGRALLHGLPQHAVA